MSVYTNLEATDIQPLLDLYQQGELVEFRGIAAGIENTNYFVTAQAAHQAPREFVLTLFETTSSEYLASYFDLMAQLAALNLPVAEPFKNRCGQYLCELKNKPAALIERLSGASVEEPNQDQCHTVGVFLADMHASANMPTEFLVNTRGPKWRRQIIEKLAAAGVSDNASLIASCHDAAIKFENTSLPRGIVHGDLFRDNALFVGNALSGIIDFYYAHPAPLIYDLAVCIADWCFVKSNGNFDVDNARALIAGYCTKRALTEAESRAWIAALELAGLRFYLSRLHDKHFPRAGTITQEKDPEIFLQLIKRCRQQPAQLQVIPTD